MRIEDVKIGMRVKYEYDGEVDYGVVTRIESQIPDSCAKVWADWEKDGPALWASPEHISPAEENTPKFKVGDKVVVVDINGGSLNLGDIVTISFVEKASDPADGYFYNFKEVPSWNGLFEHRLAPYTEPKKTAEEIAPLLWNAYKDVLNDETLAALRQVIEDVDNHEKRVFRDSENIAKAFEWSETPQGAGLWLNVYNGKYDKDATTKRNSTQDTGSAATKSDGGSSDYYKVPIKLPIELFDAQGNKVDSVTFEMQDIIYAVVGGEWTLGNILKACRRAWLDLCGKGKAGTDVDYDSRKIVWMGTDFLKRFGKNKGEQNGMD